jgi:hypothetical protein
MSEEETSFVRDWKPRSIVLRGKAFFRGQEKSWSSEVSYALVLYNPETNTISMRKKWPQRCKDGSQAWVQPGFPKKTKKKFLKWAREAYLRKYKPSGTGQETDETYLKGHIEEHCKMCKERGRLCTLKGGRKVKELDDGDGTKEEEGGKTVSRPRRRRRKGPSRKTQD